MRRPRTIVLSVLVAIAVLVALQLVSLYSQYAYVAVLAIGGVALIMFRNAIASWIQVRSAASPSSDHRRMVRPATFVLFGVAFLAVAVATLIVWHGR
jgi:hypothetical protein